MGKIGGCNLDPTELEFVAEIAPRLDMFKVKSFNPYKANFRCPVCGDSAVSKYKARGWFLQQHNNENLWFFCHNCYANKPFHIFLREFDIGIYKNYLVRKYVAKTERENAPFQLRPVIPDPHPPIKTDDALSRIKRMCDLNRHHGAYKYVKERRIPETTYRRIFYAPKFVRWIHSIDITKLKNVADHPRLVFPMMDNSGRMFGLSARTIRPEDGMRYITLMFDKTMPKIFGLDSVDFTERYYITEGAIDSLFLRNAVAMAGADGNTDGLDFIENGVFVFDSEPRNKEIHKRMERVISKGHSICIWPPHTKGKDINEMILSGAYNIERIINENTFKGIEASLMLSKWRKT